MNRFTIFVSLFLTFSAATISAADWPVCRGDARSSGIASCEIRNAPEIKWAFAAEKDIFEATPVIADGMVFLGSITGNFYALELKTGKVVWKFFTKLGFSGPAAVSGGRVFVGDADGFFHAFDAKTGKEIWKKEIAGPMNAAPGVFKNRVLFTVESGELYCLDADTGEEIWKYTSTDQLQCGITIRGTSVLLGGCDKSVQVVDVENGKLLRRLDVDAQTGATVAVNEDENAFLGTMGAEVIAFSPKDEVLWRYMPEERKGPFRSNAAVTREKIYVGGQNRRLVCLDAKTGGELWAFTTRRNADISPVVAGEHVLFYALEGKVFLLNADTGEEIWQEEVGGTLAAGPAVADGKFIVATGQGEVFCFE